MIQHKNVIQMSWMSWISTGFGTLEEFPLCKVTCDSPGTYCYGTKYSEECGYICPDGYDQKTEDIMNLGYVECDEVWVKKMRYFQNPQANTCAMCVRKDTPPVLTAPYGPGGCPKNYIPDQREVCATPPSSEGAFLQSDGVELARCSSLGADYVTLTTTPQGCGAKMSSGMIVVYGTKYECMACVPAPIVRQWEEFAGPFNRVCRGAGPTDNNPDYFDVRQNIPSVEACQALCLQELGEEGCKGIWQVVSEMFFDFSEDL